MQSCISASTSNKKYANLYGFGIKVSKQPLLPRICSNDRIKSKRSDENMSIMMKKIFKRSSQDPHSFQTEHISLERSPEKLITITKDSKINKKQILADLRKYRHKTFEEQQRQKFSKKFFTNPCQQFSDDLQKHEKIIKLRQSPKRSVPDKLFPQTKRHKMILFHNIEQTKEIYQTITIPQAQQKKIAPIMNKNRTKRLDKIAINKIQRPKKQSSIILDNSLCFQNQIMNGYIVHENIEDYQLSQYLNRKKSTALIESCQKPVNQRRLHTEFQQN